MVNNKCLYVLSFFVFFIISCGRAERNAENIKRIKINMSIDEVEKIMGKPDSVFSWTMESSQFRYMYDGPFGSSDNIYVMFSKYDSMVVGKNDGL